MILLGLGFELAIVGNCVTFKYTYPEAYSSVETQFW